MLNEQEMNIKEAELLRTSWNTNLFSLEGVCTAASPQTLFLAIFRPFVNILLKGLSGEISGYVKSSVIDTFSFRNNPLGVFFLDALCIVLTLLNYCFSRSL
jgi:hypothetical protein